MVEIHTGLSIRQLVSKQSTATYARQRIEGRWTQRVENQAARACGIGNLT